MADAKIEIKIGMIEFTGEGSEKWIESQLDKILEKAPELLKVVPSASQDTTTQYHNPMGSDPEIAKKALGTFLQEKSATTNQTRKFLATAIWLESKGKNRLKTSDVTEALRVNSQKRLNNAALGLTRNTEKGYCEKDGDQFYVTDEGKKSI